MALPPIFIPKLRRTPKSVTRAHHSHTIGFSAPAADLSYPLTAVHFPEAKFESKQLMGVDAGLPAGP